MLLTLILNLGMAAGVVTPPIPPIPTPIPSGGQFVGGGSTHRSSRDSDYIIEDEQRFKIERDDNEILNIVEIFMRCQ